MPRNYTIRARRGTSTEWNTAQNATASSITSISYNSGTSTITYVGTNTFTSGQYVTIKNATSIQYNGTFPIATASSSQFTVTRTITAGTTSTATANVPIISVGEPAYEIDTMMLKIGDGRRLWDYLPYYGQTKNLGIRKLPSQSYMFTMNTGGNIALSHLVGTGYFSPIEVPSRTNFSTLSFWRTIAGAGTSMAVGIYNHNYTTNLPDTLRYTAGSVSVPVPGATTKQDVSLSENGNSYITLEPGIYWVCLSPVDAAITVVVSTAKPLLTNATIFNATSTVQGSPVPTGFTLTSVPLGVLPYNSSVTTTTVQNIYSDRVALLVA